MPNKSAHKANAEELLNYYYDPRSRPRLAAYVNYICPVEGAKAEMEKIDPELAANPLIFPDEALLAKAKVFMALTRRRRRRTSKSSSRSSGPDAMATRGDRR